MNQVQLVGNLGRDPETRFSQDGMAICSFSLATTKHSKGEKKTSWHNIISFSKTAENAQQYLQKGSKCAVVGEIQYSEWEKDGIKKYKTEIIANNIEFLDSKKSGQSQSTASIPESQINGQGSTPQTGQYTPEGGTPLVVSSFDDSGDIPF